MSKSAESWGQLEVAEMIKSLLYLTVTQKWSEDLKERFVPGRRWGWRPSVSGPPPWVKTPPCVSWAAKERGRRQSWPQNAAYAEPSWRLPASEKRSQLLNQRCNCRHLCFSTKARIRINKDAAAYLRHETCAHLIVSPWQYNFHCPSGRSVIISHCFQL